MDNETGTQDHASLFTQGSTFDARGNIKPRRTSKGTDAYLLAREPREDGGTNYHDHSLVGYHYEVEKDSNGYTLEGHLDEDCRQKLKPQHYRPGTEWGIMKTPLDADGVKACPTYEGPAPTLRSVLFGQDPDSNRMLYKALPKRDERASATPSTSSPFDFLRPSGNWSMNNPSMNRPFPNDSFTGNQFTNNPPLRQDFGDGPRPSLLDFIQLSMLRLGDEGDEGDEEDEEREY
jgi:hypothetical protein